MEATIAESDSRYLYTSDGNYKRCRFLNEIKGNPQKYSMTIPSILDDGTPVFAGIIYDPTSK